MGRYFSAGEKAQLVAEYMLVKHGSKAAWLEMVGVSSHQMGRWRAAYWYGDLDRGLVPRDTSGMKVEDSAQFKKLQAELARERALREAEQERHDEQVARLEAVNDALGKAIGLLHERGARQEPMDEC